MKTVVTTVSIRGEHDVVLARQRARQLALLLGYDSHDQVRIATAVSEIARNVFRYARQGKVEFGLLPGTPPLFQVHVADKGPGIPNLQQVLDGRYVSSTGMGMGILGARRLMEEFRIESAPGQGTSVWMAKPLPARVDSIKGLTARLSEQLARQAPQDPFDELQRQNQELLSALEELNRQRGELAQLNKELEDTNRGVVALYAELDERADYLRRVSEVKTQFLSNMTHEFRTPLNSILSLSRILLDRIDGVLTQEQERQVVFIQKAAADLSNIVDDLLDLAKIEAGKITIRPDLFRVQDIFGALRGMLRPLLAHNSSITLVFDAPNDLAPLRTDESKVSQVLRNLISNAIKYTNAGEVRISARLDEPGWVCFGVTDTGVGIALADQDRIFEEFTQVEGVHQAGKRGTGLGLPLSRKLAQLLGGTLSVESQPGVGSTFSLRIPAVYEGPAEGALVEEPDHSIEPGRSPILIVEDNREAQFIYERFLHGTDFHPMAVSTIGQARQALERLRPAAIILDVLLEHENTWSFLSDLKSHEETRGIPVLVITLVENESKAMALGASAYHVKPVTREWLLEQLRRVTSTSPPRTGLIIDDDPASRYLIANVMARDNIRALEAANGEEGLRLLREQRPHLVVLDLMMPVMNGFQFLAQVQADPELRKTPVLVHTAKTLSDQERNTLQQAQAEVLLKSKAQLDELSARIRGLITGGSHAVHAAR